MAATLSTMLPLGTPAPDFSLPDTRTGATTTFRDVQGAKATVVMFICNHCPFVKHVNAQLVQLAQDYVNKGVGFIAISSNDAEKYPEDSPEKMKEYSQQLGYTFPYLYDETQAVARAYQAACTPDFYVFDTNNRLAYRGQLDDSRPSNSIPVTGKDIRAALDALQRGEIVTSEQKPSIGCNIKWK